MSAELWNGTVQPGSNDGMSSNNVPIGEMVLSIVDDVHYCS